MTDFCNASMLPASPDPDAVPEHVPAPLAVSYFWLLAFFVIYCARPEDWIPGLGIIPLAKIAGVFCAISFVASIPRLSRNLPRETIYLALLVCQLFLTVPFAVWPGGAFFTTLDFSKVLLIVLVMSVAVTTMARLRRLIFVQTASVAAIAVVTLLRGTLVAGRLEGAAHGIYENSNELALILVLTLPFCFAFLLRAPQWWRKAVWAAAALLFVYGIMLTGSRSGLLALIVCGAVCLREFGIRGKRAGLFVLAAALGLALIVFSGGLVQERFEAMFSNSATEAANNSAYGSSVERREMLWKSLEVTAEHPLFGIGPGNFSSISGTWKDQHNTYTQMSSEGGMPAFILYVLLLWCALANLRKANRQAHSDSEEALFAMALRGSFYGFLVGSFFADSAYHFFPYFLVGYTTALVAITESQPEAETPEPVDEQIHGAYEQPATASIAG